MARPELRIQLFAGTADENSYQFNSSFSGTVGESNVLHRVKLERTPVTVINDRLWKDNKGALNNASTAIGRALFPRDALGLLHSAWEVRDGDSLRIRIVCPPELVDIPWEYACLDQPLQGEDTYFLALSRGVTVVRHEPARQPPHMLSVDPPLRILIVEATTAAPEVTLIDQTDELVAVAERGGAVVCPVPKATPAMAMNAVTGFRPHLVLYIGHAEAAALKLHDGKLDAAELARGCTGAGVQCVVLAGCETARRADHGLRDQLLAAPIPVVIGWPRQVDDFTAYVFTKRFLDRVVKGSSVDEAASAGRRAAANAQRWEDWALVTTYLRTDDGHLLRLPPPSVDIEAPRVTPPDGAPQPPPKPAIGAEDETLLAERLNQRREESWPLLPSLLIRCQDHFAYVSAQLSNRDTEPLLRLTWEGNRDRWGVEMWDPDLEQYLETHDEADVGRPEDALDQACTERFGRTVPQPPIPTDLCVYRRDPIFRRLEGWAGRHGVAFIGLVYVAFFIGVKVVTTVLSGNLVSPTLGDDLRADLTRFPVYWSVAALFGIGDRPPLSPAIPYLRDHAEVAATIFLALNLAVLNKQWFHISNFTRDLWNVRALRKDKPFYDEFQQRCESQFNHWASYAGCLAAAALLAGRILFVLCTQGMYPSLNPSTERSWEIAAGRSWWANPERSVLTFGVELLWLFAMTYYVVRQNVVGVLAVLRGRELLRKSKEPVLKFTAWNVDEVVNIMRTVLAYVYASILLTTASLVMLYLILPEGVSRTVGLPFLLICLVCNPLYIVVPWRLFNNQLAQSIDMTNERIKRERRQALASGDLFAVAGLERKQEDLARIPRKVFSAKLFTALVGTYLPATAAAAILIEVFR